jgi:hypothetical protein
MNPPPEGFSASVEAEPPFFLLLILISPVEEHGNPFDPLAFQLHQFAAFRRQCMLQAQ